MTEEPEQEALFYIEGPDEGRRTSGRLTRSLKCCRSGLAANARKRARMADEAEKAVDEMIKRSIRKHGA